MTEKKTTKDLIKKPAKERKSRRGDLDTGPTFLGYFAAWSAEGKRSGEIVHTAENLIKWLQEELGISTIQDVEIFGKDSFCFQYSNDGESGLFFEASDTEEFQEAVKFLLEQTACRIDDVRIIPLYSSDKNTPLFYGQGF